MSKKSASSENRMVLQLFSYWKRIAKDRQFPSLVDVDPNTIGEIWPYCFILDVTSEVPKPVFHYIVNRSNAIGRLTWPWPNPKVRKKGMAKACHRLGWAARQGIFGRYC